MENKDQQKLLDFACFVYELKAKNKEDYNTSESPISDQHLGAFVSLDHCEDKLWDLIDEPDCNNCGCQLEFKKDRRFNSNFCWKCRHCNNNPIEHKRKYA